MKRRVLAFAGLLATVACAAGTPSTAPTETISSPTDEPTPFASEAIAVIYDLLGQESRAGNIEGDIWRYDVESDSVRRAATSGARTFLHPRFLEGESFAFIRWNDRQQGTLWQSDAAGAEPHRVLEAGKGESVLAFDFSSGGGTFAALRTERDSEDLTVVLVADGQQQVIRRITGASGRGGVDEDEISVSWSRDGSRILVVYTPNDHAEQTLWIMDRTGKDLVEPRFGTFGRWSSDGETIHYRRWATQQWFSLDVRSDTETRLNIRRQAFRPTLSPDGRMLAYDDGRADAATFVFDLESGAETRVGAGVAPIWLSPERVAVTGSESCAVRFADEPDQCAIAPLWVPLGETFSYAVSGGDRQSLSLGSTIEADVFFG